MSSISIYHVIIVTFIFLSGCSDLGFYWQAASGHISLLNRKQNIQDLINSTKTPSELKRKLKLVESTRSFAKKHLTISLNDAYTGYVELERSYVTMIVTAAKPLELKGYQWCYFFIGCQEYRGFFDEADANSFAIKMQAENFDVSVRPVTAYSTLGWLNKTWLPDYFSDPVLSTFLMRHDADLIATLIHEMAHRIVYLENDTSFNESFAVFVEQEGLFQFLEESKNKDLFNNDAEKIFQRYLSARKDRSIFKELIENTYEKMKFMFASKISDKEKLLKKQRLFDELRENYLNKKKSFKILSYDNWFNKKLNNTHLLGVRRYNSKVKQFEMLFEKNGRKWPAFFKAVRVLADLSKKEREKVLESLK